MTPSNFTSIPFSSIFQRGEHELIAQNIMKILKRTGNNFRLLSWDEYITERKKDGGFSNMEKPYFDDVVKYCVSEDKALEFCKDWNK